MKQLEEKFDVLDHSKVEMLIKDDVQLTDSVNWNPLHRICTASALPRTQSTTPSIINPVFSTQYSPAVYYTHNMYRIFYFRILPSLLHPVYYTQSTTPSLLPPQYVSTILFPYIALSTTPSLLHPLYYTHNMYLIPFNFRILLQYYNKILNISLLLWFRML